MHSPSTSGLKYVQHPLNISKSKASYSFSKSQRFLQEKSFSPNKFYDLPSSLSHRSSTMGFGNRSTLEKDCFVEPSRYRISSGFDRSRSKTPKFTTFGISRDEYYKGKQAVNPVGPGAYQISQRDKINSAYMGSRINPPTQRHTVSATTYVIKQDALNKLNKSCRIKTEYYPKSKLHEYNNKIPGPGSYHREDVNKNSPNKSNPNYFGKGERIKKDKPSNVGPGSYKNFSQFG